MVPGSCVHASSLATDSSVDPENFHPDDLRQCLSTSSFKGSFKGCTAYQRWPQVLVSMQAAGLNSSVDPDNFHPDDLQQCVSQPHHLNHSFPVSCLGNSITCWGLLSAQYLRAPASAVRPKLKGSVCHKREVGSLSYIS